MAEQDADLRVLIDAMGVATMLADADGVVLAANEQMARHFGLTVEALLGKCTWDLIPPELAEQRQAVGRHALETGKPVTFVDERAGRWLENRVEAIPGADGVRYAIAARDITAYRREAAAGHEKFRAIAEATPFPMAISRIEDGLIRYANPALCAFMGMTEKDLLGRQAPDFYEDAADRVRMLEALRAHGQVENFHVWVVSPVLGRRRINASIRALVIGDAPSMLTAFNDDTSLFEAEQQRLQLARRLRQAEKLEALGTLSSGIAHDFNNLLTPMMIGASLIAESGEPEFKRIGDEILRAGERASALVGQILRFAQPKEPNAHPVGVLAAARNANALLRSSLPITTSIELSIPEDLTIQGDGDQFEQVLINLVSNAVKAMGNEGHVVISGERRELDDDAATALGVRAGAYARIEVSDFGPGIADEVIPRLFDPFFTTRGPGEGTGLGLAVVHGIVTAHRGAVAVSSEEGHGTTFVIHLPVGDERLEAELKPAVPAHSLAGLHVMLVDDEPMVLSSISAHFRRHGATVSSFESPRAALEHHSNHPVLDLVITDLTMPEMAGPQFAEALRDRGYLGPIALISGRQPEGLDAWLASGTISQFAAKPLTSAALTEMSGRLVQPG